MTSCEAFYATSLPCHKLSPNGSALRPAFHGTRETNLESIYRSGLLIPGKNNNLRVINGSTHGVGIYTARVSNAALACGFSRMGSRPILVCGILDDAKELTESRTMGRFNVTAESSAVRHVGDAIVVFDEARIAPLFESTSRYEFNRPQSLPQYYGVQGAPIYGRQGLRKVVARTRARGPVAFLTRRAAQKRRP